MNLDPRFKELLRSFNDEGVRYLVVGAYAVAFHGHPRNTFDLDIWLEASEANADAVMKALEATGYSVAPAMRLKFSQNGCIARLGLKPAMIDLLTGLPGAEFEEAYHQREKTVADGVSISLVGLKHLRDLKAAVGRHQDLADLDALPEA